MHPTRLGLALNFAVYYHDIMDSPERACFLAKDAFDEAIAVISSHVPKTGQTIEDSLMILQLLRDDMILWSGEIQQGGFTDTNSSSQVTVLRYGTDR